MCMKCVMKLGVAGLLLAAGASPLAHAGENVQELANQARMLAKSFGGELKKTLISSMKAKGPANSISVCNVRAPEIARQKSEASGWMIGRTSLKLRNIANTPDPWELKVLRDFESRKAAGADPATLEHFEIVETGGKKEFRYMKAIVAGKPCMTCHGSNIKPELRAKITSLYPRDHATGFKPGDIRGAFTLTRPLN